MIRIDEHNTPWEIACMFIDAKYTIHNNYTGMESEERMFELEDLRRIGEHLINYANTEKEEE